MQAGTDKTQQLHYIASRADWVETFGETELIGGWAEVTLDPGFAALIDASGYQVFVTSYDAVHLFVQNRTPHGFEIHALPVLPGRRQLASRCGYRIVGRCAQ